MEKILIFFNKYGFIITTLLLMLVYFKQCGISREETKMRKEMIKNDSLVNNKLDNLTFKLDSTLISNSAVVNSNNATSNAINNQKQVVVKVVPTK